MKKTNRLSHSQANIVCYIYGLKDPITKKIRYIGKTTNVRYRLTAHLLPSSLKLRSHKNSWLKKLIKQNIKPEIIILAKCKLENANRLERKYITIYNKNSNLTNGTIGGDGWPKGQPKPHYSNTINAIKAVRQRVYIIKKYQKTKKYFKSIVDCAKFLNEYPRTICAHLRKRRPLSVKGHHVFYANRENKPLIEPYFKSVIGVNLYNQNILYFDVVNHVSKKGFGSSTVYAVCKGIRKHYKGYFWFYA